MQRLTLFVLTISLLSVSACATVGTERGLPQKQPTDRDFPMKPGVTFSEKNVIGIACAPRSDMSFGDNFFAAKDAATLMAAGDVVNAVCMTTKHAMTFGFSTTAVKYNNTAVCVEKTIRFKDVHCYPERDMPWMVQQ